MSKMMKIAKNEAKNSPCNRLKVGAVSVSSNTGMLLYKDHNRPPGKFNHQCKESGCTDINHAEMNVLLHSLEHKNVFNKISIFVTHEPCIYCAKAIIEVGVDLVVFEQYYESKTGFGGGYDVLNKSNTEIIQYIS